MNPPLIEHTEESEIQVDVVGLESIDYMLEDKLNAYMNAESTPSSDVLATYEVDYSAQDASGTQSAKRTVHIGA